jgi:hypothetical protein
MRNPRTIAAITRRALCLALVVFCFGAWLAPVANAQVGGVVDGVLDTVSGGDSANTASDADASSGQEDSGSGDGSLVGNVVGSLEGDNKTESSNNGPLEELVNAINETADETGVSEVVGGTVNAVDSAASQLTGTDGTVKQVTKALTGNGGRDKKNPASGPGSTSTYPTLEVLGQTFANANLSNDGGSRQARVISLQTATSATPSADDSVISQIGRVAIEAIEKAAFPIALMLMVGAFLMVQNRIDRKDPKLALAPVDSERDLLIFT